MSIRNPDRTRLFEDSDFQFMFAVIIIAILGALIAGGVVAKHYLGDKEIRENKYNLAQKCLEYDTAQMQESCVSSVLRIHGEDPTAARIKELQEQIRELEG